MIYYALAAIFPLLVNAYLYHKRTVTDIDENQYEKSKKRMLWLAVLPMILLYGLRYKRIGSDTIGYARFFEDEIRSYSFNELFDSELMRFETGFRLYTRAISWFFESYTMYFLVTAVLLFGILVRFANKYTENPFVFLYMFMTLGTYQFYETGLRQALAMSACLIAVDFVHNKKPFKFIITVLIAATFHKSAYIFFILYPMARIKNMYLKIIVNVVAGGISLVGFTVFQEWFNKLLGYEYEIEETGNGQIFAILVTLISLFSLIVLFREKSEKSGQDVIVQMTFLTVIFWLLRLISRTAERISFYFTFGMYIYFSQTFKNDKDKSALAIKLLLLGAFFALFMTRTINASYKFFWQGV